MKSLIAIDTVICVNQGGGITSVSTRNLADPAQPGWCAALMRLHAEALRTGFIGIMSDMVSRGLVVDDFAQLMVDSGMWGSQRPWVITTVSNIPIDILLEWFLSAGALVQRMLASVQPDDQGHFIIVEDDGGGHTQTVAIDDKDAPIIAELIFTGGRTGTVEINGQYFNSQIGMPWDALPLAQMSVCDNSFVGEDLSAQSCYTFMRTFIGYLITHTEWNTAKTEDITAALADGQAAALALIFGSVPDANHQTCPSPRACLKAAPGIVQHNLNELEDTWQVTSDFVNWFNTNKPSGLSYQVYVGAHAPYAQPVHFDLKVRTGVSGAEVPPGCAAMYFTEVGGDEDPVICLFSIADFLYEWYIRNYVDVAVAVGVESQRVNTFLEGGTGSDDDMQLKPKKKPVTSSRRDNTGFLIALAGAGVAGVSCAVDADNQQSNDQENKDMSDLERS